MDEADRKGRVDEKVKSFLMTKYRVSALSEQTAVLSVAKSYGHSKKSESEHLALASPSGFNRLRISAPVIKCRTFYFLFSRLSSSATYHSFTLREVSSVY